MDHDPANMTPEQVVNSIPQLRAALNDLPVAQRDELVDSLLAEAVLSEHDDNRKLVRLMQSILLTAELHRNRRYMKALAEDNDTPPAPPVDGDVFELFTAARAARSATA